MPDENGNNFEVAKVVVPFEVDPDSLRQFVDQIAKAVKDGAAAGMQGGGEGEQDAPPTPLQMPEFEQPDQPAFDPTGGNEFTEQERLTEEQPWTKEDVRKLLEQVDRAVRAIENTARNVQRVADWCDRVESSIAMGGL